MSDERTEEAGKPFDRFELFTALLLGLTAVGAAVASLQSGQWGGKQLDAFAEANTLTTKASTQYNEDTVLMNADYAAVAVAKQHILEARDASGIDRERHFDLASYFYMTQLSANAYKAMELPEGYWEEDEDDAKPATSPAPTAAPAAAQAGDEGENVEAVDEQTPDHQAAAAPEVLLLMPCGFSIDRTRSELDLLTSRPGWNDLPAVRNQEVYAVEGAAYFNRSGPRLVDGVELLAALFHPHRFENRLPEGARRI